MPPVSEVHRTNLQNENKGRSGTKILIDQSKREPVNLHTHLRSVNKRLKAAWNVEVNQDEIADGTFTDVRAIIFNYPRAKFSISEIDALRRFLNDGGAILILMNEDGENGLTNVNFFIEEYGISVNNDSTIRTVFYKYFDPKEALIADGILNRSVAASAKKNVSTDPKVNAQSLTFVYPMGASLSIDRRSIPILSTGSACFPINRPIAACHQPEGSSGRLLVCGSVQMFSDAYFDREENGKLFDVFMDYLLNDLELNKIDGTEPNIEDYRMIPNHIYLSQQIKVCLQEGDLDSSLSSDFMKIYDQSLSSVTQKCWPKVLRIFDQLGVKQAPMTLIVPEFEVMQPPLEPAVYPPNFRELPPPMLEMFDLDEMFSSQEVRLAQLTNKCEDEDIDYYVKEVGEICGITASLPVGERSSKRIMEHIISQLFEYKKSGQDDMPGYYDFVPGHADEVEEGEEENLFSDIDEYDEME